MVVTYVPEGVCAKEIRFEVESGIVRDLKFVGGCPGNLSALSKLIVGMPVPEVITRLKGNVCKNNTSCADQLVRALEKHVG